MDYRNLPEIFNSVQEDFQPVSRTIGELGELLKISYYLMKHPILKEWEDYELHDPFKEAMNNADHFKIFNRTLVERTIHQTQYYRTVNLPFGILTLASEGIEHSINELKSFMLMANQIYYEDNEALLTFNASVHYFRLTGYGRLTATLRYLLQSCIELITSIKKEKLRVDLSLIKESDKFSFLLQKRKELQHEKSQLTEKTYAEVLEYLNTEIDYFNAIRDNSTLDYIQKIVSQFMSNQQMIISNNKLLQLLINDQPDEFCEQLKELVTTLLSYHDISGQEQEKLYHVFLLGLFNQFNEVYHISSNKEAGHGRFDILLLPYAPEMKSIIFEVKRLLKSDNTAIGVILDQAIAQIKQQQYYYILKEKGIKNYTAIALGFSGKFLFYQHEECLIT